ncbi:MAG: MarR family transcriptional regulator [Pirellulales bacterium]
MDEELENQAADLGAVIREILKQFQSIHAMAAEGPHAHLTHHELFLMEHLGEEGPQKMRSLAEYLGVAVNTMTTIIDGLENKGLVLRSRSQEDRRVIHIELTPIGKETLESAMQSKMDFHRAILGVLEPKERNMLLKLFRKIALAGEDQVSLVVRQRSTLSQ